MNSIYYDDIKKSMLKELNENIDNFEYLCEEHNYAYTLALMYLENHTRWYEDLLTVF